MEATALPQVTLCVGNELFRDYAEAELQSRGYKVDSVDREGLTSALAECQHGILILQADQSEPALIELSRRLRRIFAGEIRVLLLSADYRIAEEAESAVDAFMHFPVTGEELNETLEALQDQTRRILIIDDSKLVHNHVGAPLEAASYEVHHAYDGEEGLEVARSVQPDLVICDIEMPRMNGFEVCSAIRATEEISDTYIIMSSTLGSAADQQKGFEAGVDEYIIKPVVIPELLDRIEKVFDSALSGRESVLVLEENEKTRKGIVKSLKRQGFTTRTASGIRESLDILNKGRYDLLISQIQHCDGNMIDLISDISSLSLETRPDVVVMTSRNNQADEKMVRNAGASGVLSKPFAMDSLLATVERALAERRSRLEKAQFEKYMSKASMKMALEKSVLSGECGVTRAHKKYATIFFSDIVGFTNRCEKYSAQEIVCQINQHFEILTRVIMEHEGDIDKFIGDACMAFWSHEDPEVAAEHALRSVLAWRRELEAMNQGSDILREDPIGIRIGLNSGEIILCDIGAADARIDLTVIGDAVNVAARLESAAKQYGVDNLIGESTLAPLRDRFAARPIDWVRVKGKHEPVACYELLGEVGEISAQEQDLLGYFEDALERYREGDFAAAQELLAKTEKLERVGGKGALNPTRLYRARCQELQRNPPREWTGVWELKTK